MSNATPFVKADALHKTMPTSVKRMVDLLEQLQHGVLTVQWPNGQVSQFGQAVSEGLHADLQLHNWVPFTQAMKSGDIGFAESFIAGDWTSHDVTSLLRLFIANRKHIDNLVYGHWLGRLYYRIKHLLKHNTRSNSQKNIQAHYDLGNDFYQLWLDETMNYSSAWFDGDFSLTTSQAQSAKVRRALQKVGTQAGDRVIEIGCGWGALAEMGAVEFGAKMYGVTLSHEQLAFAQERLHRTSGQAATQLRLQDYRDIDDGPYDAICSIEMIEAVGQAYWPEYFATIARLLKQGGKACVQSIVIDDSLYERYIHSTDFIQQYIFPGGCLPCPKEFQAQTERAGLRIVDAMSFGLDYAETLRRWRAPFLEKKSMVLQLGFDERFMRIWEFYLCYCEAAFDEHNIDVVQYTLEKI